MQTNGWTINGETAVYRRDDVGPTGEPENIMMSAQWDNNPVELMRATAETQEGGVEWTDPQGLEDLRGITIRVMVNGEPVAMATAKITPGEDNNIEDFAANNHPEDILQNLVESCRAMAEGGPPTTAQIRRTLKRGGLLEDTLGWPNTPSPERLQRAMDYIESNPELLDHPERWAQGLMNETNRTRRDAGNLLSIEATKEISREAIPRMTNMGVRDWHQHYWAMRTMAREGCGHRTIGGAINIQVEPGLNALGIIRVQRDPDWMGACINLRDLRDAQVLVLELETRRGRPGTLMASANGHPEVPDLQRATREFPKGEATMLRDVLKWHGTAECLWVPQVHRTRRPRRSNRR